MQRFDEQKVRSLVVDYWKGELSEREAIEIDAFLESHPETAEFYARMQRSMDAAAELPVDQWLQTKSDLVWERIEDELDEEHTRIAPLGGAQARSLPAGRRSKSRVVYATAAAIALAAGLFLFLRPLQPAQERGLVQSSARVDENSDLAWSVAPAQTQDTDLSVYASEDANYSLPQVAAEQARSELHLNEGALVIEFLAAREKMLVVVTPDAEVEVTGTIFYVDVRRGKSEIGVIEGEVIVRRKSKPKVAVKAGDQLGRQHQKKPLPKEVLKEVERHVDVEEHRTELKERAADAILRQERSEVLHISTQETPLLDRAEVALEQRDYATAARLLERSLSRNKLESKAAAYARLEVARLYLRQLEQPQRAKPHLRAFLVRWPEHAMAPYVYEKLCELGDAAACAGEAPEK